MHILPPDPRKASKAVLLSIVGVTAFILLLDAVFPLTPQYFRFFTAPLWPRMAETMALAVRDEVLFRLVLMSLLYAAVRLVRDEVSLPWVAAIIALSQFANIYPYVLSDPVYASLRYWAVGSVWGWLYWRHGWVAALVGHTACHLLLDPMLFLMV